MRTPTQVSETAGSRRPSARLVAPRKEKDIPMKVTQFLKIRFVKVALGLTALIAIAIPASAATAGGQCGACPGRLFITSAVEHPNGTVTFPLHQAKDTFAFLVSDRARAFALDGWLRVPERVPGAVRGVWVP
jgi:hypothetical protein